MIDASIYDKDIRLSYSTNSTFESCLRKFELTRLYSQPPRNDGSTASGAGTALHAGIQNYWEFGDEDRAMWAMFQKYPHALSAGWRDDRSLEACMATLESMIQQSHVDEFELATIVRPALPDPRNPEVIIPSAVVGAVEVPFEIELVRTGGGSPLVTGRRLTFVGSIDGLMRSRYSGKFRTRDVKTHRDNKQDRTAVYKHNAQQTPYGLILEHIQGHAIEDFEVNYLDVYVDLVEPRLNNYNFNKTRDDVNDWFINRIIQVQRLNQALSTGYFPRTENGCMSFNRPCNRIHVCDSRNPAAIQDMLLLGGEPEPPKPFVSWVQVQLEIPNHFNLGVE